jgi:uncharacterized protein (DUF1499 family)
MLSLFYGRLSAAYIMWHQMIVLFVDDVEFGNDVERNVCHVFER